MTVRELAEILSQCDPDALVVAHLAFRGIEEITSVERKMQSGVGHRMGFDEVPVIQLDDGNVEYMRSQGHDVLPAPLESEE